MDLEAASCFLIMTIFAKGLPVLLIPEQPLIAPVRDDVVDYGGGGQLAFLPAFCAQRMPFQEGFSFRSPAGVVPTRIRTTAQPVTAPHDVILAEDLAGSTKSRTAWIAAGPRRYSWHSFLLPTSPASACRGRHRCCWRRSHS